MTDESNVVRLPGITKVDIPPSDALDLAKGWDMEHCVIVGHDVDGKLCFGGSTSDMEKIVTLLERAKHWVMTELAEQTEQ